MARPSSNTILLIITALGLGLFAVFVGWAFYAGESLGGGWENLLPIWPMVVLGLVVVGALTGVLMWLAFYSSRHGYDEPHDFSDDGADP